MIEPVEVVLLVVNVLDNLSVPYFVGGSIAGVAYGLARTTLDADLDADMIREAVASRESFNVIHLETMFKDGYFHTRRTSF